MSFARMRKPLIYASLLAAVVLAVALAFRPTSGSREVPLSYVIQQAQAGNVKSIEANGDRLLVQLETEAEPVRSRKETSSSIQRLPQQNDVPLGTGEGGFDVTVRGPSPFGNVLGLVF